MKRILLVLAASAAIGAVSPLVWAHGAASWIMQEPRFVTVYNVHCCGPSDCATAPKGAVRAGPEGYVIAATGQTIAYDWKALYRSIDEDFWWCRAPSGQVKCLFAPQAGA